VYFASGKVPLLALDEVSLSATPGEFLGIVGPSGCGKTTLLHTLAGLIPATEGKVEVGGVPVSGPSEHVGLVFQKANLMPWRSVLRNVTLPLEVRRTPPERARALGMEMLDLVGLEAFAEARPHELSGGMQQKVAIARALALSPSILLMDEPFGGLDAISRDQMNLELLRIWKARRQTIVLVTHNIQEAIFLADRVLVLTSRPGRVATTVEVTLPRPRELSMVHSPEFGALSQKVRAAIH
jgi:NitT/TauT family transport system ATP-binding protein